MIRFSYILILVFLLLADSSNQSNSGLEIYQVKHPCPSFNPNEKSECYYCFELNKHILFDKSLIDESDIKNFDWEKQQIILNENGWEKIRDLYIPLEGLAVAVVLNGEPIYGFWFWNEISSFGCDRVYTYPKIGFRIKFGLPKDNTFGKDPRFNPQLKEYILTKYNK